ncbi:MAG TPA: glycosyltransferase family A protein, partial [Terriglobia bacterium]|nr:glycosyltransferase family A protein [Terriglobia bacterium]
MRGEVIITSVDRQNELVQSLRKQLEATERELTNQKWVFERFLESPSWRMTYPIRWMARQARTLRDLILGASPSASDNSGQILKPSPNPLPEEEGFSQTLKTFLTSSYRAKLQNFLSSEAQLNLPSSNNPEISIVVVLYNRAELTLHCLQSIVEQGFKPLEIIIVDNASTDETPQVLDR